MTHASLSIYRLFFRFMSKLLFPRSTTNQLSFAAVLIKPLQHQFTTSISIINRYASPEVIEKADVHENSVPILLLASFSFVFNIDQEVPPCILNNNSHVTKVRICVDITTTPVQTLRSSGIFGLINVSVWDRFN